MNGLDIVLLVAAVVFGFSGWRQGFVAGVLAFAGFLAGGVVGLILAPVVVSRMAAGLVQSLVAVGVVLLAASVGQALLGWLGTLLRSRLTWKPARTVDAVLGAAVSVVAMLVVTWFLASSLRPGPVEQLSQEISDSKVVTTVDLVMPDGARTLFSSFRRVLADNSLPTVFGALAPERIRPVSPPQRGITSTVAVQRVARSIVKIIGTAQSCSKTLDGSGFVMSPHHVLTNAHVVAGVSKPVVQVGGRGPELPARVVLFDSHRDLAVLYVPSLRTPALLFDDTATRGDQAVVAGFPGGGDYRLVGARVRDTISARGPDIYQRTQVTRDVFSLYADVRPGNSGGPLLSLAGNVYGVIFAKSLDDPKTGYALTVDEIRSTVATGRRLTTSVSTHFCT